MEKQAVNILLVDDRQEDLLSLELILKNEDYHFFHASSGRDALRILLKEQNLAIILMDVKMPIMDGLETARMIRESERLKHIPIIFLTANDDASTDIFKGYNMGGVDYLIKPVIPEILKAKVGVFADLYKKNLELQNQHKNLLELNNMYGTLLKTESEMGQGVIITENENIVYMNDAVCKIFCCKREEISSIFFLLPKNEADQSVASVGEQMHNAGEIKVQRKDGKWIYIEYSARNIEMDGKTQRLSIIRDITGKKQSEELLRNEKERAERAEIERKIGEQFLANMSHEIRTPMNAIIGFTNVMLKTPVSDEQHKYLDAIKISGENLLVILNDILDFSRIRSGKVHIENKVFNMSQIISTCLELMQPKATEKGIKLSAVIDENIYDNLIGDPTRLNQALLNLLANAIKFTFEGEVLLTTKLEKDTGDDVSIEITVKDTGIGIPKDKLQSIFEAFIQAESDTNRKYGGTGLGLAIVKQLMELQHGTITVVSEEGKGSSFSIHINYKKAGLLIPRNFTPLEIPKNDKTLLNILLVEDHEMNQMLVEKILSDWGWKVMIAENGFEAVEKIKTGDYDIILMDIQMPKMDGYEATRQIRKSLPSPKNEIPIMAMTAHVVAKEEEKCYNAGMDGYISKPFDSDSLYLKIVSLVRNSRSKKEENSKASVAQ